MKKIVIGLLFVLFGIPYSVYLAISFTSETIISSINVVIQILIPFIAIPIVKIIDMKWKKKSKIRKKNQKQKKQPNK